MFILPELLLFGLTWPFWVLGAIVFFGMFAVVEFERPVLGLLSLVAFALLWQFFGTPTFASILPTDLMSYVYMIGGYALGGIVTFIGKWYAFTGRLSRLYEEEKEEFLEQRGVKGTTVPDHLLEAWRRHCSSLHGRSHGKYQYFPVNSAGKVESTKYRNHKAKIATWATLWFWTLIWLIINEPMTRFFRFCIARCRHLLQYISDMQFRKFEDDNRDIPPTPAPDSAEGARGGARGTGIHPDIRRRHED